MTYEQIRELFFLWIGETEAEQSGQRALLCEELCRQAAGAVERQTRTDLSEQERMEYEPALENLAAAKAIYDLTLLEERHTPQSISAAELKISMGEKSGQALAFYRQKEREAAPALRETRFYFGATAYE